jgi:hypothetical protein
MFWIHEGDCLIPLEGGVAKIQLSCMGVSNKNAPPLQTLRQHMICDLVYHQEVLVHTGSFTSIQGNLRTSVGSDSLGVRKRINDRELTPSSSSVGIK